jgi:hypothetical protein
MTARIEVAVRDGFATIDFVDPALRGPALARLADIGGGESIEAFTRGTPRKVYRVPEGNAREAGLLTDATAVDGLQPAADTGFAAALAAAGHRDKQPDKANPQQQEADAWPDGTPSDDWTRAELDAYAKAHGIEGVADLPNKAAVLAAINA